MALFCEKNAISSLCKEWMREDRRLSRGISGTKNAMVHNGKMRNIIVKYIELYQMWLEESTRKFIYLIP
jgi:hypothetical protein